MTHIIHCLSSGCCLQEILLSVLDVIGPIVLEILIISILFDRIVRMREQQKWKPAQSVLFARLIRLQDSLLLDLVPDTQRKAVVHAVRCGDITVDTLFDWLEPNPDLKMIRRDLDNYVDSQREFLAETASMGRNNLNQVIQAHASHIEPELFGLLLDVDTWAARLQATASLPGVSKDSTEDLAQMTIELIRSTLRLRDWVFHRRDIVMLD